MLLPPRGEDNGFGDIEAALMATDAGALEDGKEVVTLGGTYNGLDTALVVKTCWSGEFFTKFGVLEIIAEPRRTWPRFPEYDQEGWSGDFDLRLKWDDEEGEQRGLPGSN